MYSVLFRVGPIRVGLMGSLCHWSSQKVVLLGPSTQRAATLPAAKPVQQHLSLFAHSAAGFQSTTDVRLRLCTLATSAPGAPPLPRRGKPRPALRAPPTQWRKHQEMHPHIQPAIRPSRHPAMQPDRMRGGMRKKCIFLFPSSSILHTPTTAALCGAKCRRRALRDAALTATRRTC